jgi:hypothetical protein
MSRSHTTTKHQPPTTKPMASAAATANKVRIHIIYYSMYGHVATCKFIFKIGRKI